MTLRLNGSTSGYVEIDAPAVAGDNTLTLPSTPNGSLVALDSSGRLGIGITSPASALHVVTSGAGEIRHADGTRAVAMGSTGTISYIGSVTAGNGLALYSANEEKARIDASGRLLVGASSAYTQGGFTPSLQQHATSASGTGIYRWAGATSGAAVFGLAKSRGSSIGTNVIVADNDSLGSITFSGDDGTDLNSQAASITAQVDGTPGANDMPGRLGFSTTSAGANLPTERMRIDANGNVEIRANSNIVSTGASLYLFDAASAANSGNSSGRICFYSSDSTDGASIRSEISNNYENTSADSALVFKTYNGTLTERMRIAGDGTLITFGAGNGIVSGHSAAAGTSAQLFMGIHSRTSTTTGGTTSFQVWTNGNVQNTNNSYGAISDIKLKENIVDANSQWDDLKALQVRNYNFKEGQTHTQIGLVAQEVEPISSGLVYESPDRDAEGNDLGTVTKSVNYSVLYMKAVKALQEAMERIETLEAKVAALEVTP
jgi:hypothetical protein